MDLSTFYLGKKIRNPLVASASPLCRSLDNIRLLEDSGVSAIVLHSLFEEQITGQQLDVHHFLERDAFSHGEAQSYFPEVERYNHGPDAYLEHIRRAKEAVKLPVVASLNGTTDAGWIDYAKKLEQAGADAIELNVYFVATNAEETGAEVERRYIHILEHVKSVVKVPIAMKLSPYFSSMANMAKRLERAGADGLVLFNRFYQPDIDLEGLQVVPNLQLSTSMSNRLPMRWIAILFGNVKLSLAASSGIHTAQDVLKLLMAGANVTMMTSALLKHGVGHVRTVLHEVQRWLEEHEYESVTQLLGSMSQRSCADPEAFERANYMKALVTYQRETGN